MYIIRDREAGNIISKFTSYSDAAKELEAYEAENKRNGEYTPDFYEIVEQFGDGDPSGDRLDVVLDGIDCEQRDKIKALADKYGMDIMRNSITSEAGGVSVFSSELISELDALADAGQEAIVPCVCIRDRFLDGEGYQYKIYCPPEWFDLWGWR